MKKFSLLSIIVILAMLLAACGGGLDTSSTPGDDEVLGTDAGLEIVTEEVGGGAGLATDDMSGTGNLATEVVPSMEATRAGALSTPEASAGTGTSIPNTGSQVGEFASLDQLIGLDLLDANSGSLGSIQDFVINVPQQRVDYIVVDRGGQSVLVPWSTLAFDRTNSAGFNFNGAGTTFENAPAFSPENFDFMDENWDRDLLNAWRGVNTVSGTSMPSTEESAGTSVPTTDANDSQSSATQQPTQQSTQGSGNSGLGTGDPFTNTVYAILASELENMNVVQGTGNTNDSNNDTSTGTQEAEDAMPGTQAAPTQVVAATPMATLQNNTGDSSQQGDSLGTIVGAVVNVSSGDVPYLLLSADGLVNTESSAGSINNSGTSVANATPEPGSEATSSVGSGSGSDSGSGMDTGSFTNAIPVPFRLFTFVDADTLELPFQANVFSSAPIFTSQDFNGPLNFGWDNSFQTFWQQNGNNPASTNP